MKKLLLLVLLIGLLYITPVQAQLEQGKIMTAVTSTVHLHVWGMYGSELMSLGFVSTKYNDSKPYKCTSLNLLPRAGYFVMDNLAVGIDLLMSTWTEKSTGSDSDDKYSLSAFAVGPFARYYYPLDGIYPFAEVNACFGTQKYKWKSGSSENIEKKGMSVFGLGVGVAKPLGDRVTVDALLGYTHVSWKQKDVEEGEPDTQKSSGIGLRVGFTILLGPQ